MGKIMEAIFCVAYMITVVILGTRIVIKGKNNPQHLLFGILSLVLVFGDAFHLVPRVLVAIHPAGDYTVALGIGKLVTSITMTLFYLLLYRVYCMRHDYHNKTFTIAMVTLAALRILLCLLPQNDWTGAAPVIWGIYRNIPFTIMGILIVVLFYRKRQDPPFRWMWLAVTLSFAFYLPVVLWAAVSPMVGMLMMPKTIMYVWAVVMGYRLAMADKE